MDISNRIKNTNRTSRRTGAASVCVSLLAGASLLTLTACSDNDDSLSDESHSAVAAEQSQLEEMLDTVYDAENVISAFVAINDGSTEGDYGLARGIANSMTNEMMTPEHQFHIASMTKPLTVTLLLQLIEEGRFTLDSTLGEMFGETPLSEVFSDHSFTQLNPEGTPIAEMTINAIQGFGGNLQGADISLRQLMQHTHGMPDITFDAPTGGQSLTELTIMGSLGAPLPSQSLFTPGEGFYYGDTGLLIAALVIEQATGMSLADNYRARIFDPIGMNDTYLLHYEDARSSESPGLSERYFDLSSFDPSIGNVNVDGMEWNTSLDFGGGGLVSTAADLDKFYRALFSGDLLADSSVFGDPAYRVQGDDRSPVYGLGFVLNVDPDTDSVISYEHGGFWGSYMAYFPGSDTSAVFTANQVAFAGYGLVLGTLYSLFSGTE